MNTLLGTYLLASIVQSGPPRPDAPPQGAATLGEATLDEASAMADAPPAVADTEDDDPWATVSTSSRSSSGFSFEDSLGSFSASRIGVDIQLPLVEIGYDTFRFDWNRANEVAAFGGLERPWGTLERVNLEVGVPLGFSDAFDMQIGMSTSLAWEEQTSNASTYAVELGVRAALSDRWALFAGADYTWHPDVDLRFSVFPAVAFGWNTEAERGFSALIGIPLAARYKFTQATSVSLGISGEGALFRLADDNAVAPAGYAEFSQFNIDLAVEHRLSDAIRLRAGVSASVGAQLRLFDRAGREFAEEAADGGEGVFVSARFAF